MGYSTHPQQELALGRQVNLIAPETLEVIPDPTSLMEAMRAVGYTVESAIADLIDNSISAGADVIEVQYDASETPFISILDNGDGMSPDELTIAMRHGSHNPADNRDPSDLGRFGLGLKTASLSQCRKFTVASKKDGVVSARQWDLDFVQSTGKWLVIVPNSVELETLPLYTKLDGMHTGTLVTWQDLDRLTAGANDQQSEMTEKLGALYEHLALVFHRFTEREEGLTPVEITVNGLKIPSRDPFLKSNTFRQPLEGQVIRHERGNVRVTPYILPPVSHLSKDEIDLAGGKEGLRGTQGFYVYRNRRLVMWGTWFKLVPKDEFFKLTRVQVDIPNTFDDLWALDIKKSAAFPPESIRNRLKELIPHFASTSKKTITYPGRRKANNKFTSLWTRVEPRHGVFRYEMNSEHPAIQSLSLNLDESGKKQLQFLLGLAGEALPFESIYADMSADSRPSENDETYANILEIAEQFLKLVEGNIDQVLDIDPIVRHPTLHARLRKELENDR